MKTESILTEKQELEIKKMASLVDAANKISAAAIMIGVGVDDVLPMITALAKKKHDQDTMQEKLFG